MKINFGFKTIFLATALFLGNSCSSDKDGNDDDLANATHTTSVFAIGSGLLRLENMKVYVSETPYKNYKDFKPLASKDLPNVKKNINDSVVVNMSKFVGKTVYFTVLRKNLLSDNYHNITVNKSGTQTLESLKQTITESKKHYQIGIVTTEPRELNKEMDQAKIDLIIKKGSSTQANKPVYYLGPGKEFSATSISTFELKLYKGEDPADLADFIGKTNSNGILQTSIPVDETGYSNSHIYIVIDNGKVKYTIINVNSLNLKGSIQY